LNRKRIMPDGPLPWLSPRKTQRLGTGPKAPAHLTEEQLADYHAGRLHRLTIGQTLASLLVLSIAAAVVILPFVYMLMISLKGTAEIGNGKFLPQELSNFTSGRTAWVELRVPAEKAITTGEMSGVPVMAAPGGRFAAWQKAGRLPGGTVTARRLYADAPLDESGQVKLLLEASDETGALSRAKSVYVFLPAPDQKWMPVEGQVRERTWLDVTGRLLNNYKRLLHWDDLKAGHVIQWLKSGYPRWYFNSLLVAALTVVIGLFFDSLAAYGFAKFQFPFKRTLFAVLIATLMIPYPVTLVPTFFIFARLGFYNTYLALVIPGIVSAFGIFLVRQYMETIPDDMRDAARVDGAGDFQVYWKVMLPAARPVLAALAVFRFIFQWNTYLYPLVLTNKDSMKTVQLGIATMQDVHGTVDYGLQMAGSAIAVLPILIVYLMMQKHFIAGITMGSGKG